MAKVTRATTPDSTVSRRVSKVATQAATAVQHTLTDEQIRQRAYEIFQRRGGFPGDAFGDWVLAERELRELSAK